MAGMSTEQRVDHLTDAVGDLSQDMRELRFTVRELRGSVLTVQETQAEHSAQLRALTSHAAAAAQRLSHLEANLSRLDANVQLLVEHLIGKQELRDGP